MGGGFHLHTRGEKMGYFYTFLAPKAPRKFFEHFFVPLGKFLYQKVIKS